MDKPNTTLELRAQPIIYIYGNAWKRNTRRSRRTSDKQIIHRRTWHLQRLTDCWKYRNTNTVKGGETYA